jgi:hypothetical protein
MFMMTPSLDQIGEACRPAAGGVVTSRLFHFNDEVVLSPLISSIGYA